MTEATSSRSELVIGLAQLAAQAGDLDANLARHVAAVEAAARQGVSLLVFPELSLTGYEPGLAAALALSPRSARLAPLRAAAERCGMHVVAGLPLNGETRPRVGVVIFDPAGGEPLTYAKRYLHPGEEAAFEVGETQIVCEIGGERVAFAICADTNAPAHGDECASLGATVYLAAALITAGGYDADTRRLAEIAERYAMLVGMANHNGVGGGMTAIGGSGFWTDSGPLAVADDHDALVIATRRNDSWHGRVVGLDLVAKHEGSNG
ncbi:carbon-nitrogen hydrolase family protein [Modicisalibacter coralii]|uniref:carbon-nitrogen hydrolase family protein n=1 Tax=Modicisalibacter coralii TaxID=2304602 RepID=UPI00100B7756|nr:carbon-nitrogen hydrolase family protein [Halomonas coralii]